MGHEQKHNVHWENPWIELITRNVIKTKVTVKQEALQILCEKKMEVVLQCCGQPNEHDTKKIMQGIQYEVVLRLYMPPK